MMLALIFVVSGLGVPTGATASQIDPPDCNTWTIGDPPPDDTWLPTTQYIEIGQYEDGSRYILTLLMWDDVSGFGLGSTYESDVLLNNTDESDPGPGTYLDGSEDDDQISVVTMAESNLPS